MWRFAFGVSWSLTVGYTENGGTDALCRRRTSPRTGICPRDGGGRRPAIRPKSTP